MRQAGINLFPPGVETMVVSLRGWKKRFGFLDFPVTPI